MSKCLNPDCLTANGSIKLEYCQKCGGKLRLKERYRALKIIGKGGFGRTFLAIDEDKPSKPDCVIKQFLPQAQGTSSLEKASELFAQEAERLDHLGKHPQIPELLAYFTFDKRQYLIQQFIEGLNLQQELNLKGNFNEEKIRAFLADILPILKYVHQNKVIHRDIKPENLIRRASDQKIFLVDFGASKVIENTSLSVTGTVIGSAQYASPEQSMGKPQYCSDLYSLGVTCLHLLTGIDPFDLFDTGEGDWVWRDYLVDNPVSDELGQVLDKLVQSGYKKRYQSVDEVMRALNLTQSINKQQLTQQVQQSYPTIKTPIQQQKNFTENLPNGVKLEMMDIPAGSFLMGTDDVDMDKLWKKYMRNCFFDKEVPQHQVTLKAFMIGKYPITQAQYQTVMGKNPSYFSNAKKAPLSTGSWADHPVDSVSWYDAQEFCQKLSEITGKKYKLPSEAQWEYACRAGSQTEYYFGDDENQLSDYAWYGNNSGKSKLDTFNLFQTHPSSYYDKIMKNEPQSHQVGLKKRNSWGLYDMYGNLYEWCEDDWHENYHNAPTDGTAWIDNDNSNCSQNSNKKVVRGGSWYHRSEECRSANRSYIIGGNCYDRYGFRVICELGRTL